jgi:hypothetical protein
LKKEIAKKQNKRKLQYLTHDVKYIANILQIIFPDFQFQGASVIAAATSNTQIANH